MKKKFIIRITKKIKVRKKITKPSIVFKNKKLYNRKIKHKRIKNEI